MKERITELRKTLNFNQTAFGERVGLTASGVSNLENGIREVQERHIKLILAAFPAVSEQWLREGIGEMFKTPSSEAERLVKKYSFPDIVGKLLTVYEGLDEEQQEAVLEYARQFIATLIDEDSIDAKVEAYRQELLAEKDAAASSASQTGNALMEAN